MEQIASDVWHVAGASLRVPGGVRMPLASTLIRLPDRSLLLYSPVRIDDALAAEIAALGEVAHIVAPSLLHHLYVRDALVRWPRAVLHGVAGLAAKRTDLAVQRELGGALDPALRDAIAIEVIAGAPKLNEAVLFHRPSGTVACADFVFNITRPENLRTRMVLAMMGVGGRRLAQSRVWRFAIRDRAAARTSIDRILGWPITRVAPAHGEVQAIDAAALAGKLSRAYGGRVAPALAA